MGNNKRRKDVYQLKIIDNPISDEALEELVKGENPYYCPFDHCVLRRTDLKVANYKDDQKIIVRLFICPKCKKHYSGIKYFPDFKNLSIEDKTYVNLCTNHVTKYLEVGSVKKLMKNTVPGSRNSKRHYTHDTDGMSVGFF